VGEDLASLHTEGGIRLGDTRERVIGKLGVPSDQHSFGGYTILWYLERPQEQPPWAPGLAPYQAGYACAYALKSDRVVEIWLHYW